jgi:hypothetical protein
MSRQIAAISRKESARMTSVSDGWRCQDVLFRVVVLYDFA